MNRFIFCYICLWFTLLSSAQDRISIHHGPYLQNLKETEVTIVWIANKPSIGWVELAPDDQTHFYNQERPKFFNVTNGVKNTSLVHTVKLTGLMPGTRYRYRIFSQEVLEHRSWEVIYGNVASTSVYRTNPLNFKTNDRKKAETAFIMVNDIHGRSEDIPALLKVAGLEKTDMVIFNGDMLSQMLNEADLFNGFMDAAIQLFAKEIPMYYARGNHETRGPFATFFQNYFSPKEQNLYYHVRQGPVCIVFLDTGEDKPDSDIEYSGITDYDNYRTQQAKWLAEMVKSNDFTEAKYRVIIAHMPPITGRNLWHGQKEVLEKFVPILNEARVDVMLCAHTHSYSHHKPGAEVKFPVVVNAHQTVIKGIVKSDQLQLIIKDLNGKVVDQITLNSP